MDGDVGTAAPTDVRGQSEFDSLQDMADGSLDADGVTEKVQSSLTKHLGEWAKRAMQPRDVEEEDERRRRILDQLRLIQDLREP